MTYELDILIAIAFIVPVAAFAVLNIVLFRTGRCEMAGKPATVAVPYLGGKRAEAIEAANDSEYHEAA